MSANFEELKACRACDSKKLEKVIDLGSSAIADDYCNDRDNTEVYPLACNLCLNCGLLQLSNVVSASDIYDNYIYWSTSSPGLEKHFGEYAESVCELLQLGDHTQVLDLGCNDGMLLRHFKRLGCKVAGVEPSKQIAEYANQSSLNVINSYWHEGAAKQIEAQYGNVDIITANNVFANVNDIQSFVQSVQSVMAPDGVFIVETGYHLSLIDNFVFDNIYHEHLSYFSVSSLQTFFSRYGMRVFHAEKVDTKGGSIRVFVCFETARYEPMASLQQAIVNESRAQLFEQQTYVRYMDRINALKTSVCSQLQELKAEGVTLIGFGASATVTTVIHALEIGQFFDFLVDDNELKQGTFSPGYQIPVKPCAEMYLDKPCCVVILPWRFADMFMSKHQNFLNDERFFLKIIPTLQRVGH